MKKLIKGLICSLIVLGCDCSETNIQNYMECGRPCYPGPQETLNVGACAAGIYVCDDNRQNPICVNAVVPHEEICDNIDNDCDGKTDNIKKNCSSVCEKGTQTCVEGVWGACSARQPSQELCNNIDDNCDGIVDNEDLVPIEFCYEAPASTLSHGECHPGVKRCRAGQYIECVNQKLPSQELCNGKDDDCNGIIDDNYSVKQVYNIIILDLSGSMDAYLFAIKQSFNLWKNNFVSTTQQKFALVLIPNPTDTKLARPYLSFPFSDITSFVLSIASTTTNNYIPEEATIDALKMVADPADPLGLKLPAGAYKRVILFSDELPQTYFYTSGTDTTAVGLELKNNNIPTYVFGKNMEWDNIATPSGGVLYNLPTAPIDIYNALKNILKEDSCE